MQHEKRPSILAVHRNSQGTTRLSNISNVYDHCLQISLKTISVKCILFKSLICITLHISNTQFWPTCSSSKALSYEGKILTQHSHTYLRGELARQPVKCGPLAMLVTFLTCGGNAVWIGSRYKWLLIYLHHYWSRIIYRTDTVSNRK